jgi:multicomponent Na+:H+ antiporter subunit D
VTASYPVFVPLVAAALSVLLGGSRVLQRIVTVTASGVVLAAATWLAADVDHRGLGAGGWQAPLGIPLVADRFGTLLVCGAAVVALIAVTGAVALARDRHRFWHPILLVLLSGASGAFLTGDLFNLFVAFEVTLISSYVLLSLDATEMQIRAASIYVPVNLLGSLLFLVGVALLYGVTGTLNIAELARTAHLDVVAPVPGVVLLTAIGVKAAVVPLGGWLPLSYPAPSATTGALFAGVLTTVGVAAAYRVHLLVYRGSAVTGDMLVVAAVITMVVGGWAAATCREWPEALSFVVVAQVGFMVLGAGLATPASVTAGVFFIVQDVVVKAGAFVGSSDADRPHRWAVLLPGASLAGLPLTAGFIGKFLLLRAAVLDGAWIAAAAALLASLLVLVAVARHGARGTADRRPPEVEHPALARWLPTGVFVAAVGVAVYPQPLIALSSSAADLLLEPGRYAAAVLG